MRQTRFLICLLGWTSAVVTTSGCVDDPPSGHRTGKVTVAVSIIPQAWLVRQIGGDHVDVLTLVKPGTQPETHQPTDTDAGRTMAATAYFCIGVPFETGRWFEAIRSSGKVTIVDTRKGIGLRQMTRQSDEPNHDFDHHDGHRHGGHDPHIWLCPRLLKIQAQTITQTLVKLDPQHADTYQQNLHSVEQNLDQLDQTIRHRLAPFRGRAFVAFHPAWGYFADEYGLRQIAVEVQGKDPSDQQITQLQRLASQERLGVVFVPPQISDRLAYAIAKSLNARIETLDPLAPDVAANLLRVAEAIAASLGSNETTTGTTHP